ncbi:MAG: TraR/DksA C4-type zinc finger protein [Deltaproteobacteria bacterium]|nr:TraR/DksA C4-type zinc finger protein [Deltaproteobacteria bacterium]
MNEKKKAYFTNLLNKQLNELLKKEKDIPVSRVVSASEQAPDFTDQATFESDMDLNLHIKERDNKLIFKIKEALERIENGTYGICEVCGQEITESRLKARPVTTVCIKCKQNQEAQEKLRGI